jgi:hypothetical protein
MQGGIAGVLSTGSYENLRPSFLIEETIEDCLLTDEQVFARTQVLYDESFRMMKEAETKAVIERIEREKAGIRFYVHPESGVTIPSVTSVINWDADFFVPPHELQQYASQSQIVHAQVEHFIETGKWEEPKTLTDIWADIVIVSKGSLHLPVESGFFPAFLKKYPVNNMTNGHKVFLPDVAGTFDFEGIPDFPDALKIPTVFDVKRTPDRIKDGKQLSAYCKAKNLTQGIIVPLNAKTEQKFSKPVIYSEAALDGFFKMFQKDRENFKKRYGI